MQCRKHAPLKALGFLSCQEHLPNLNKQNDFNFIKRCNDDGMVKTFFLKLLNAGLSPMSCRFRTASCIAVSSGLSNTWDRKSSASTNKHQNKQF